MLSWILWFLEKFGYIWSLGAIGLASFLWFGAFQLPGWIRASVQQVAVAFLVFAACTYVMRSAYSDGIAAERASWEAKRAAEDDRRDHVLEQTQIELQDALARVTDQDAELKVKHEEIDRLSRAHDHDTGLQPDSLRRLNTIRRGGQHGAR